MKDPGAPPGLTPKRQQLRSRLARAHGHLHGVLDMIDARRNNEDILHQVNAVRAALTRATTLLLDDIMDETQGRLPASQRAAIDRLRAAVQTLA
ncbi:MAG: metal-sensitive transcriptional regulator [Thermoplasmatota archaeon]